MEKNENSKIKEALLDVIGSINKAFICSKKVDKIKYCDIIHKIIKRKQKVR